MCGIMGFMAVRGAAPTREDLSRTLTRATNAIRRRGPDSEGQWISTDGRVGLGHRRLAVIDLSPRGHQPMVGPDGSALTFNGEIYNYKELRLELGDESFFSQSDTEVLLHALIKSGESSIARLDGMFAFGFYSDKRLLLAVDPAGKKPIYTYWDGKIFAFASEIKALREIPALQFETDTYRLKQSLVYGYVPSPYTMYKHIRKLPAGHFQEVDFQTGPHEPRQYWDVPLGQIDRRKKYKDAQAELQILLSEAVRKRLVADVPVGCFLSGGLDSSCIALEAAKHSQNFRLRTFSAGFSSDRLSAIYDETRFARKVAANIGSQHTELQISTSGVSAADIMAHFDEPFGDSSAIPTFLLCEETRKHVTVVLSGDGGDEIFGGYLRFRAALASEKYKTLCHLALGPAKIFSDGPHSTLTRLKRFHAAVSAPLIQRLVVWNSFFAEADFQNFLGENEEDFFATLKKWDEKTQGLSLGERILYYNFKTYLFDDLLPKMDRMSMYHALEVRSPFLDKNLVEFAFRLPDQFKFDVFHTKKILKDAFRPNLGRDIVDRPKHGFAFPLESFLQSVQTSQAPQLKKIFPQAGLDWSKVDPINRNSKQFMLWSLENCLEGVSHGGADAARSL